MVDELYQKTLIRMAAQAVAAGTLDNADVTVSRDNPTCGDRVTVQLRVTDGTIQAMAHDTRACLICQASASMIGSHAEGLTAKELSAARAAAEKLLKDGENADLNGAWPELDAFRPVAAYKSRHNCLVLPFDAVQLAFDKVNTSKADPAA